MTVPNLSESSNTLWRERENEFASTYLMLRTAANNKEMDLNNRFLAFSAREAAVGQSLDLDQSSLSFGSNG